MANEIFTRIQLKYDSWANWNNVKDTFVPLKGEVCIVNPGEDSTSCLLKVGDGSKTFGALPWLSALAADVAAWAKADDVRLKDQKLEFYTGNNVIKTVDLSVFATEAEVEANYKKIQTAVTDPTANGKSLTFIDTISQNAQGVITATKKNVNLDAYALKTDIPTNLGVTSVVTTDDDVVILTPDTAATGAVTITGAHKDDYNTKTEKTTDATSDVSDYEDSITIMVPTLEVDKYGHTKFLGETSHIITIPEAVAVGEGDITIEAGEGLELGSDDDTFNVNQDTDETITLKHAIPTGATEGEHGSTGQLLQSVTTDKFGHITGVEETGLYTYGTGDSAKGQSVYIQLNMSNASSTGAAVDYAGTGGINVKAEFGTQNAKLTIDGSVLEGAIDATDGKVNTLIGTDTNKSARAIATEVAKAEIGSAGHLKREVVTELPAVENADPDTIYMMYKTEELSFVYHDSKEHVSGDVGGPLSTFPNDSTDHVTYIAYENTVYNIQREANSDCEIYFVAGGDNAFGGVILERLTAANGSFTAPAGTTWLVVEFATGTTPTVTANIEGDSYAEFMIIEGKFEQIGDTSVNLNGYATEHWVASNYKKIQDSVKSPTTKGTSLEFIDYISQNPNGEIWATKKSVNLSEYAKLTDIPEIPKNHKILQEELSGSLTSAQVVGTWSQNANGEVEITTRDLTPADIGAKTKQTAVTDKITDAAHVLDSLTQNENGEISYTVKKMTPADIGAQKKSVFVDRLPTTGEANTTYYLNPEKFKVRWMTGYSLGAGAGAFSGQMLVSDGFHNTLLIQATEVIEPFILSDSGSLETNIHNVYTCGSGLSIDDQAEDMSFYKYENHTYIYNQGVYISATPDTATTNTVYAIEFALDQEAQPEVNSCLEGFNAYEYVDGTWVQVNERSDKYASMHLSAQVNELKIADNNLASIAKSGSIYDVKEGSNTNNGDDKVDHPKYLIFNCGSSTAVI